MNKRFKFNAVTQTLLLSLSLGSVSAVYAETTIDRDTVIDNRSPQGEDYLISNGATLTINGAVTGALRTGNISGPAYTGHLLIGSGSKINGDIYLINPESTLRMSDSEVTGNAWLAGKNSSVVNSRVEGFLAFHGSQSESRAAVAEKVTASMISSQDGDWVIADSDISNTNGTGTDPIYHQSVGLDLLRGSATLSGTRVHATYIAVNFADRTPLPNAGEREFLRASNSRFTAEKGPVFQVGAVNYRGSSVPLYSNADILLADNSFAASESGELLRVEHLSDATLTLDGSVAEGNISVDDTSSAAVTLNNGSQLSGAMSNVNALTLDATSHYSMTASSDIGSLALGGGSLSFTPSAGTGFKVLTLDNLSGGGDIAMNTDVAGLQGDFIDVTGNATGRYQLSVANTGAEPVNTSALLALVRTGSGDANFSLKNGAVDVGVWQYQLVQVGNQWGLVQTGKQPVVIVEPVFPGQPPVTVTPIGGTGPVTSASTDAVLSLASVNKNMFYGELNALNSRTGELRGGHDNGVWGTFLNNTQRLQGAWNSAYKLEQNGLMLGGDTTTATAMGDLTTGVFISNSDGKVKHARGGESKNRSWGGGLYTTLQGANGWYADAVVKLNHFDTDLSAQMTGGDHVEGGWNSWGYGLQLEGGREFRLAEHTRVTPYAALSGYRNQNKSVTLSNDMQASLGNGQSLRGELGVRGGMTFAAGSTQLTPYATVAVSQEFVASSDVRINQAYSFDNDYRGTTGRINGGLRADITPAASVWVEAGYAKGDHNESPINASAGVRVSF